VVFWVIDPDTDHQVPYGERGQVVMNHVSKGMFIPNNVERDTAIRVPGPEGQVGDSLAAVAPVATFGGEAMIEGSIELPAGRARPRWRVPHPQPRRHH
jgi:hypothetical protein